MALSNLEHLVQSSAINQIETRIKSFDMDIEEAEADIYQYQQRAEDKRFELKQLRRLRDEYKALLPS